MLAEMVGCRVGGSVNLKMMIGIYLSAHLSSICGLGDVYGKVYGSLVY